jgi:hemoglobin
MRLILSLLLLAGSLAVVNVDTSTAKEHSLYSRLGGKKAITAVVDDFVANVAADKRINRFFAKTDIPRLKRLLVEQICAGSGGPCTYTGRDMKSSHKGLGIGSKDFDALVEDLAKSLNKFKVPAREQKELVAILAPMKKDIVERK